MTLTLHSSLAVTSGGHGGVAARGVEGVEARGSLGAQGVRIDLGSLLQNSLIKRSVLCLPLFFSPALPLTLLSKDRQITD